MFPHVEVWFVQMEYSKEYSLEYSFFNIFQSQSQPWSNLFFEGIWKFQTWITFTYSVRFERRSQCQDHIDKAYPVFLVSTNYEQFQFWAFFQLRTWSPDHSSVTIRNSLGVGLFRSCTPLHLDFLLSLRLFELRLTPILHLGWKYSILTQTIQTFFWL